MNTNFINKSKRPNLLYSIFRNISLLKDNVNTKKYGENFYQFRKDLPYDFKKSKIRVRDKSVSVQLTKEFTDIFPNFTHLISISEITEVTIDNSTFRLFTWTNLENEKFGWLADTVAEISNQNFGSIDTISPKYSELLPEHLLFINNIGGIEVFWNAPTDNLDSLPLACSNNFMFSLKHSFKFTSQDTIYHEERWIFDFVENQLNINELVCFSEEANGNLAFYNTISGEVFLLLGDHNFEYVTLIEGHPEHSFYTINGIKTFTDFVELLAKQFIDNCKLDTTNKFS